MFCLFTLARGLVINVVCTGVIYLQWMQKLKGKEYLVHASDGKTTLAGRDLDETRAPQRFGITSLSEIIHEYEHD